MDLWKHFVFNSVDGKTNLDERKPKPTTYCHIEKCKHPTITYFGNTTNVITLHLAMYYPK